MSNDDFYKTKIVMCDEFERPIPHTARAYSSCQNMPQPQHPQYQPCLLYTSFFMSFSSLGKLPFYFFQTVRNDAFGGHHFLYCIPVPGAFVKRKRPDIRPFLQYVNMRCQK